MGLLNMNLKNVSLFSDKSKLLNIGLVILSLVISKNIYSSQMVKINAVRNNQGREVKKNSLIADISALERKIQAYKQVLYKRDAPAIISDISEMASSAQIKISSITPDKDREYPAYSEMSVKLTATAPDYHRIGDFVSRLENSTGFYTIETLNIASVGQAPAAADKLSFEMSIIAVIFKD